MKYFQCSKCKTLLSLDETAAEYQTDSELDNIKLTPDIMCHDRRMRELTEDQYDHEVLQRDYVDNGGDGPSDTAEMQRLNI